MPPGRHRHGRLRRAPGRGRPTRPSSSPTSATAAAGWWWPCPESWIDVTHMLDLVDLTTEFKAAGKAFRVSTKYGALTQAHFRRWGIYHYQIIHSEGALELHPSLGIADIIVDLTSSGTTLKDNRLREIEGGKVLDSASCLIGHAPSLRDPDRRGGRRAARPAARRPRRRPGLRRAVCSLEVAGGPEEGHQAAAVAAYLAQRGAQHVVRGEVWDERGRSCWRVTALVAAGRLASLPPRADPPRCPPRRRPADPLPLRRRGAALDLRPPPRRPWSPGRFGRLIGSTRAPTIVRIVDAAPA